ncbi:MAG: DNA-directed RNA polymerase subunit P [Candidatus Diapherotrites archaeon]|nr:DNA-directed RNA polymerase subunit P [Candidatus Diapherotrites archaeon]
MPYKCLNCGEIVDSVGGRSIRCPACAYKVFSKTRDPVVKNVLAR